MLVFEIKDDKEHILEKKSKKMILGLDDQGHSKDYTMWIRSPHYERTCCSTVPYISNQDGNCFWNLGYIICKNLLGTGCGSINEFCQD